MTTATVTKDPPRQTVPHDIERTTTKWELIDPYKAEQWLRKNTKNRKLSSPVSSYYAAQMSSGDWMPTGQTIIFDWSGDLLDGQHRLDAIIRSGVAVWVLVVRGINPQAFKAIDRGKSRSIADILHMSGEANATITACACRYLSSFKAMGNFGKAWGKTSFSEVAGVLESDPEIRQSAIFSMNYTQSTGFGIGSPSLLCVLHYLFTQASEKEATYFFDRLGSGAELSKDNPILHLRNIIIDNRIAQLKKSTNTIGRFCIKAWNVWAIGEPIKVLRVLDKEDLSHIEVPVKPLHQRFPHAGSL